jgi:hypothetical protein
MVRVSCPVPVVFQAVSLGLCALEMSLGVLCQFSLAAVQPLKRRRSNHETWGLKLGPLSRPSRAFSGLTPFACHLYFRMVT